MTQQAQAAETPLPHSRQFVTDLIVAAVFICLGIAVPGSVLETGNFQPHISGISIGFGLAWMLRAFMVARGVNRRHNAS